MSETLKSKIDFMVSNRDELKKLTWADGYARHFMAMYLAQKGVIPDTERILEINRLTKNNTGVFSAFRAQSMYFVSALLSVEPDYQRVFDAMLDTYKKLCDVRFHQSSYLTIAAYMIASTCKDNKFDQIIINMRLFYDELKKAHPFITGQDDYASAAVIAVSGKDIKQTAHKMEILYQMLDADLPFAGQRNTLQALCSVLALSDEETAVLVQKYVSAVKLVRENGIRPRFGSFTALAAIVCLSESIEADIAELVECEVYLKDIRGYGKWSLNRELRFSLICSLLLSGYQKSNTMGTALMATNLISLIVAQQVAAIAATSAAASASGS